MMRKNYTCGIDIGTHTTKVVIVRVDDSNNLSLIATGTAQTSGMRRGYIINTDLVAKSIKEAVASAEKVAGFKIKRAFVSVGGISLSSVVSSGSVVISKADQEITNLDVSKAITLAEENLDLLNKKVIHTIPLAYKLDGKEIYTRPEGMRGAKLDAKVLFVTCLKQNLDDIATAFVIAKIEIEDVIASPIAESLILLTPKQMAAGCALVNIGYETVSLACFENNLLISLKVFPLGSMDITKDIALGLQISLEEAESIKLGSVIGGNYSKKKIDEIIEARLSDIFELVENHLKRLKRNELLPAGVIFTGGGTYIKNIEDLAKVQLKLPIRIGPAEGTINNKYKVRDASWYTALGLVLTSQNSFFENEPTKITTRNIKEKMKSIFKQLFSQLLP